MDKNNDDKERTYRSKGLLWGMALGSIVGAIITRLTDTPTALAFCISIGMLLGFAIGSNIKRQKSDKE